MASMATENNDAVIDFSSDLKVIYKNGIVERLNESPIVPPSPEDPVTGVSSKDITISPNVSARLFLPKLKEPNQKLPIIVYYHGGGFCVGSAFSFGYHNYMNILTSEANAIGVSVEYRLAPEHPLPAAYEDCWTALQWVASHAVDNTNIDKKDPWLINHGKFDRLFIGGDSAGGNIVHHIALRAGTESLHGDVKISGAIISQPYFWGSKPLGSVSKETNDNSIPYKVWFFVCPSAPGGIDNPMVNPFVDNAPSLSGLGCSRLFVNTAGNDLMRERALEYVEAVKKSGWKGEVELVDVEGEVHCFQIFDPDSEKAKDLMRRMTSFVVQ